MPPAPATVTPAPAPATAAPAKAKEPPAPAKSPVVAQAPKEEPPAKEPAAKAPPARRERPAPAPAKTAPARTKAAEGGDYFVQVGAFTDPEKAKRVAAQLRAQNYPVEESVKRSGGGAAEPAPRPAPRSTTAPPAAGADRYDVIVTGGSAADLNARLAAKGLAAEPAGEGVRIRPSLPLRDAVALSKDLSADGFKVQVRRSTGGAAPSGEPSAAPGPSGGRTTDAGQALYRVRVGGYPDRATAMGVLKELQGKGFQPFIARGRE
jgi:cell division septation protein DedD